MIHNAILKVTTANIGELIAYITLAIDWVNPYKFVSLCGDYVRLTYLARKSRMLRCAAGRGSHFAGGMTPVVPLIDRTKLQTGSMDASEFTAHCRACGFVLLWVS